MPKRKESSTPLHYIRKKDSVEISGHPDDVRKLAWFDMLLSKALWAIITLILLFILPKAGFIPLFWKYIKNKLFTIPLPVLAACSLLLSG